MSTEIDPIKLLRIRWQQWGSDQSLRKFASEVGVSAAYLSDVLRGSRLAGPRILKYLGLKRKVERSVIYSYRKNGK